jgi:hypothetical protein
VGTRKCGKGHGSYAVKEAVHLHKTYAVSRVQAPSTVTNKADARYAHLLFSLRRNKSHNFAIQPLAANVQAIVSVGATVDGRHENMTAWAMLNAHLIRYEGDVCATTPHAMNDHKQVHGRMTGDAGQFSCLAQLNNNNNLLCTGRVGAT